MKWTWEQAGDRLMLLPNDPQEWAEWQRNLELRRDLMASPKAVMAYGKMLSERDANKRQGK